MSSTGNGVVYPPLTWSASRHRTLHECERRYYWRYYGAHHGWRVSVHDEAKLAWRLKHLSDLDTTVGIIVHNQARVITEAVLRGEPVPAAEELYEASLLTLRHVYRSSRDQQAFFRSPAVSPMLREVYYRGAVSSEDVVRVRAKLQRCLATLVAHPVWEEIRGCQPEEVILPLTFGVFPLPGDAGVTVFAAPDMIYFSRSGLHDRWCIVDWKSGRGPRRADAEEGPPKTGGTIARTSRGRTAAENLAAAQLAVYGLYARVALGLEPVGGAYDGRVIWLLNGTESRYWLTDDDANTAASLIHVSLAEMRSFLHDPYTNVPLPKESFALTPDRQLCRRCPFLELCRRELAQSDLFGMAPTPQGGPPP